MATIQARCNGVVQSAILKMQLKIQIYSSDYRNNFIFYESLVFLKLHVNFQMNFYASKERIVGGGLLLEYNYRLAVSNLLTNYPKRLDESEIATFFAIQKNLLNFFNQ